MWFPVGTGSGMYDFIRLDSRCTTRQNYDSDTSWSLSVVKHAKHNWV